MSNFKMHSSILPLLLKAFDYNYPAILTFNYQIPRLVEAKEGREGD